MPDLRRVGLGASLLLFVVAPSARLFAQEPLAKRLWPAVELNPAIPRPSDFLGHEVGARPADGTAIRSYVQALAAVSERVRIEELGRSAAGRPLLAVRVATGATHARRDAIREQRRAARRGGALPDDHPVTVWLQMGIHGDEPSGVDAGLLALYRLVADRKEEILDGVVVVFVLDQNPDGRERFLRTLDDRRGFPPSSAPFAFEHRQPWPGGRVNHHFFDLNRDWVLQTQPETRALARALLDEGPQIVADFHEMESEQSSYVSAPPGAPLNPWISSSVRELWRRTGASITAEFEARQWSSWTNDRFPADFPGYGGAWPCFFGAAGLTLEQGSAGGGRYERRDGSVVTFADAVSRHAASALALVSVGVHERREILATWQRHFREVTQAGLADTAPLFLFPPGASADGIERLREVLARNGIAASRLADAATLEVTELPGTTRSAFPFPAGTLVVSARSAERPLVLALLDPDVGFPAELADAERARRRSGRPSELYDVVAWNLPLLLGIRAFRSAPLPEGLLAAAGNPDLRHGGAQGVVPVAWFAPGGDPKLYAMLTRLSAAGVRTGMLTRGFTAEGMTAPAGSVVVLSDRNEEEPLRRAIDTEVREHGTLRPLGTARSEAPGFDLGGPRTRVLGRPSVRLLLGRGTSATSAGAARWFLEQGVPTPFVAIDTEAPLGPALKDATVLIVPDGESPLSITDKAVLERFLDGGGTIVAFRGAADLLASEGFGLLPLPRAEKSDDFGVGHGAILAAEVDLDAPLSVSVARRIHVSTRAPFPWRNPSAKEATVVARYARDGLLASGWMDEAQLELLADSPLVVVVQKGAGRIVAFREDPLLRGAAGGLWPFVLNAIWFGGAGR